MGMSLQEYAKKYGVIELPPEEQRAAEEAQSAYLAEKERVEAGEALKESIVRQIADGSAPEQILYTALKAIGVWAKDPAWAADRQQELDAIYSDLQQQSFITDNAAIAAERLEEKRKDYNGKLRKKLEKAIGEQRSVLRGLNGVLMDLNKAEGLDVPE